MTASYRSPSFYGPVEAWLAQEIGLDPASVGPSAIAVAAARRMAAQKIGDVAAYAALLAHSRAEAQQLIEAIVVPETSFFRDHHPFIALRQWAAREWMPTHPTGVMRLLSMPCSTGEEPFSMAMALLEEGMTRFLVEGVDISHEALARAEKGLYRRNSFRGGMREEMDRFFTMQRGKEWRIRDEVRRHVRFRQANLLDPAFGEGGVRYDAIFCRNLLIYLDAAAQKKVMEKIRALLAPGGFLCVGHAEAYLFSQFGFRQSEAAMAFCFHAPGAGRLQRLQPPSRPEKEALPAMAGLASASSPLPGLLPVEAPPFSAPLPSLFPSGPGPGPGLGPGLGRASGGSAACAVAAPAAVEIADGSLEESQRLADAGAFDRAEELALAHLREAGPSARLFCLLALICDAQGREGEAAAYYRKTLYLEPGHAEALAHLSIFLRRKGDTQGAEQLQRRLHRVEKQGGFRFENTRK